MLQPALLGGLVIGVLSALPVINLANCCCAWILFGGGLAAYLLQQQRPAPISLADGALVGLTAGAVGAVVWTIVAIPLNAVLLPIQTSLFDQALAGARDMPPEARAFLESLRSAPMRSAAAVIGFVLTLLVCTVFGTIGGLFGALLFRKAPPAPPAAPPAGGPVVTPPPLPAFPPPPGPPSDGGS